MIRNNLLSNKIPNNNKKKHNRDISYETITTAGISRTIYLLLILSFSSSIQGNVNKFMISCNVFLFKLHSKHAKYRIMWVGQIYGILKRFVSKYAYEVTIGAVCQSRINHLSISRLFVEDTGNVCVTSVNVTKTTQEKNAQNARYSSYMLCVSYMTTFDF